MTAVDSRAQGGFVGRPMKRKEDPRLITGRATYVDDIQPVGTLWMAFVRSPEAHARVTSIDTSAALAREDVVAVFTGDDLEGIAAPLPCAWVPPGVEVNAPEHWPLAKGHVAHVGDPVALVIGVDRYSVVDAAEDVVVEYEPLPVVVDPEEALKDEVLVHPGLGSNKVHEWSLGGGDLDAGFAAADVVIERRIVNHRVAGGAIEPRAVLAEERAGHITIWSSTQVPHFLRLFLSILLGLSEERIRVIAPEVGGGFGSKLQIYGEEILCAWAAQRVGRPVKWVETRSEAMMVTHHGRDQIATVRVGAKRDGTVTAFHAKILADFGAYLMLLTPAVPALGAFVMSGCYRFPAVQTDIVGVLTNKFSTDAIRGAGRPEATHMIEVAMDQLAHELGLDPLDVRRRNFIAADDFPHETALGIVYDSGNYQASLAKLLEHLDVAAFRAEQERLRGEGIHRGLGFSTYTEICGLAPSRVVGPGGFGLQTGLWESALVRVHLTGAVTVYTGTSPHGQGHETGFAQIVADRLGCDPEQVEVVHGDTAAGPQGLGTYGSRSLAVGGEAVAKATAKVVEKGKALVAHKLEASPDDIEVRDGRWIVRGSPEQGMTLAEVAGSAYIPEDIPEGMEPGLEETAFYDPNNFVFPFGAHAAIVDVDAETGKVKVVRYLAVDDCGPAINPLLIDGQVHGGIVHSIGQALYEQVIYDEIGQLVTGTFVDYALPTAAEIPSIETDRTETPSPVNSLGVKGIGEAGTIAASAAVANAVIDALRPLGVDYMDMPFTPMRVWNAIQEGQQ
ncbi:MAG: aldehyde oxidase and xanthine dehydrogenase molybdopterin binding protein [Solirubrobacterales bacterium]|jgi:carbon-monoxide dehydrogenase large subunit|nr:aldehyde oxidase and xanthine dehydrogenase molybdopterin binding protein [Solirubrobacterales bacterium]